MFWDSRSVVNSRARYYYHNSRLQESYSSDSDECCDDADGQIARREQRAREEILTAQQEDVRALAPMIEAAMRENVCCVLGGEEKIRANEALFGEIRPALRT